jgi:hypothetical protein
VKRRSQTSVFLNFGPVFGGDRTRATSSPARRTGVSILGVSVDPASAAAFLPVSGMFQGNTHLGLQLLSNNEIRVDVTGDLPLLNDQLILDLRFGTVSVVPRPVLWTQF